MSKVQSNPVDEACAALEKLGWKLNEEGDTLWNSGIMVYDHPDSASTIEIAVAES